MGEPPSWYIKNPDNPKRWIVDDEAAQVVRRIYGMTLDGLGREQIAAQLEREGSGLLAPEGHQEARKRQAAAPDKMEQLHHHKDTVSPGVLRRYPQLQDLFQILQEQKADRE